MNLDENATQYLLSVIAAPRSTRSDVAFAYAAAIALEEHPDWSAVNHAIIGRWSESGLQTIKRRAWGQQS